MKQKENCIFVVSMRGFETAQEKISDYSSKRSPLPFERVKPKQDRSEKPLSGTEAAP